MMYYDKFYTLYGFTDNRQRSKISIDNRQSNEILTDKGHVDPPPPFRPFIPSFTWKINVKETWTPEVGGGEGTVAGNAMIS